ncbi:hypothetical protein PV328_011718 [Microctonus aethiopoides]|uniref:Uncharacterized protein n=1 Tax=Microctonus aethiopoides TaxID=144406 RepID=A0AA39EUS5_9HYME|nr:hypothetical protein PV328_011718 [Microctonus aethiopoides]
MWRMLSSLGLAKTSRTSPLHFFTPNQLIDHYSTIVATAHSCTIADLEAAFHVTNVVTSQFDLTTIEPIDVVTSWLSRCGLRPLKPGHCDEITTRKKNRIIRLLLQWHEC